MSELLISADAEVLAISDLDAAMSGASRWAAVRAGTKIPADDDKPAMFVRVVSAGGTRRDLVTDEHVLVLDAFAEVEGDARDLAAFCLAVLDRAARVGMLGGTPCYRVGAGAPANMPHPQVPTHFRYSATVTAELRRSVA